MSPFSLVQVAVARTPFPTPSEVAAEGGPGRIEVAPECEAALLGIEAASHLVVLSFLQQADRSRLQVRPKHSGPASELRGVFATRSPARPNPIGLSVVPLRRREGLVLHVDRLDLADQTPIVDLKPYSPGLDLVFSAVHRRRTCPATRDPEAFAAVLERELEAHLGANAGHPEARLALAAVFIATRRLQLDPRSPELHLAVNRLGPSLDAVLALTGATFASGRLEVRPSDSPPSFVFRAGSRRIDATARPGAMPGGAPSTWEDALDVVSSPARSG